MSSQTRNRLSLLLFIALSLSCNEIEPTELTMFDDASPELRRNRGAGRLLSTFDNGTDGWTLFGDALGSFGEGGEWKLQPQFTPGKGNPGGAIFADDAGRGLTYFFSAPHRFLGNLRRYYGGSLGFDLRVTDGLIYNSPDVLLAGGGLTLVIELEPDPDDSWTSYTVQLDESAGWRISNSGSGPLATAEQIRSALRDLNVLLIRGEHIAGGDTGLLDNVRLVMRTRH